MSLEATPGPFLSYGQNPPVVAGAAPADYNPDYGPQLISLAVGLIDPRFGYKPGGAGNGSIQAYGWLDNVVIDQVPSTAAVASIAPSANAAAGVPMVLVGASGGGITVQVAPFTVGPTGLVVPQAALAIDSLPGYLTHGQSKAIAVLDPTTALTRAVQIQGSAGAVGGTFVVKGFDLYGSPMTQNIVHPGGAVAATSLKAFKWVLSITPQFTDAHGYSVGHADTIGMPLRVDRWFYMPAVFNNTWLTASAGFTAADQTNPATAATGDPRGTYALQTPSDGVKRLQIEITIPAANIQRDANNIGSYLGLLGVPQF